MDLQKIKQVVDLMKKSDLSEFEIQDQEFKLRIKRDVPGKAPQTTTTTAAAPAAQVAAPVSQASPAPVATPAPVAADPSLKTVTSPMVGTFYSSASPDAPAFVGVGSQIKSDTTVCIIEAMKVMNEIQSEVTGTVVECLVASGTSVEFGQALFRVKAN